MTSGRQAVRLALALGCGTLLGCQRRVPNAPTPAAAAAERAWPDVLAAGRTALTFRQYGRADSTFDAFQRAYPNAASAAEASYWRAVTRLDPANPAGDVAGALAALNAYRATDPPRPHYAEALVLGTLAARADSLQRLLAAERAAAAAATSAAAATRTGLVPRDSLRARDEELARARADVAEARAELERVRRRLAAPTARGRRPR